MEHWTVKVSKCVSPFAKNSNQKFWKFSFSFVVMETFLSHHEPNQTMKQKRENETYFLRKLKRKICTKIDVAY